MRRRRIAQDVGRSRARAAVESRRRARALDLELRVQSRIRRSHAQRRFRRHRASVVR